MFQVISKEDAERWGRNDKFCKRTVYAVRVDHYGDTMFLLNKNDNWVWERATWYLLFE